MTKLQNDYWALQESKRHNRAEEARKEKEYWLATKNAETHQAKEIAETAKNIAQALGTAVGVGPSFVSHLG